MIALYIIGGILLFVLSIIVGVAVAFLLTRLIFEIIFWIEDLRDEITFKKEEKRSNKKQSQEDER